MTDLEKALERVNRLLGIDAAVTTRGDEIKAWTSDEDGGRSKTCLSSLECWELSNAFAFLGSKIGRTEAERRGQLGPTQSNSEAHGEKR